MCPSPISHVSAGVPGLRPVMVNVYVVASGSEPGVRMLVDGGLRGWRAKILREAERHFGANVPPRAIGLTHGRFDHLGGLPWVLQRWPAPGFAHANELRCVNNLRPSPPANRYVPTEWTEGAFA